MAMRKRNNIIENTLWAIINRNWTIISLKTFYLEVKQK